MRQQVWAANHSVLEWAARRRLDVRTQVIDEGGGVLLDGRALIIACNHSCALDASLVRGALGRRLRAKARWVVGAQAHQRIQRQGRFQKWLQTSLLEQCYRPIWAGDAATAEMTATLRKGGLVVIIPEGDYSFDEYVHELRPGVAYAALAAGVPILPVRIDGATGLSSRMRRGHRITLRWRPPVFPGTGDVDTILDRLRRALR